MSSIYYFFVIINMRGNKRGYRAIFSDVGGVLVDIKPYIKTIMKDASQFYNVPEDTLKAAMREAKYLRDIPNYNEAEYWRTVATALGKENPERYEPFWIKHKGLIVPRENMLSLYRDLGKTHLMVGVTNTIPENARERLGSGVYGVFHHVIKSCDPKINSRKPDMRIYEKAIEISGADPREGIIFIDDMERNLPPAEKLGMATHLFTTYENLVDDFRRKRIIR
jgi:FMN phosphatase YigB (HAD superfamily)